MNASRPEQQGFTLLEVMVALAIFATLSIALYNAAIHVAGTSAALTERSLAHWLADNRLSELRAHMRPAPSGHDEERLGFAGRDWRLVSEVGPAPDPRLLKVSLEVLVDGARPVRRAHLVGFIEAQP
ncbi:MULTISPECIES: type II secretion system minor pseudopilin GspI [Pseudomonas]|uniref:type II secretion system minor pseudopilin GspI n=1 Tax=Pseudomonadaceae TaxID=135621 RepID=UPI00211418E6|nr:MULTISPECIES: type II secretion system minor pseudopilin GspI [Pseudomonas]MDE3737359.1 type II secretion system minor pseudopilin GspI [Pseudomonas resinovorans]